MEDASIIAAHEKDNTILIAEDEPIARDQLRTLVSRQGYRVRVSETGEEAVAAVKENDIDLILMDLRMPGIGGFRAAQEIQIDRPDIPIIMVTAFGKEIMERDDFRSQIFALVEKPLNKEARIYLLTAMASALGEPGSLPLVAPDEQPQIAPVEQPKGSEYLIIRRGLAISGGIFFIGSMLLLLQYSAGLILISLSVTAFFFHFYEHWLVTGQAIFDIRDMVIGIVISAGIAFSAAISFFGSRLPF